MPALRIMCSVVAVAEGGYNNYDGGGGGFYGGGGQPPPPQHKSKGSKALDFLGGLIGGRKEDRKGRDPMGDIIGGLIGGGGSLFVLSCML
ncbi:unnamed protein product [Haemonchus placei]|uniref:Uncharacterized protein n=1 Tax=Haemonchus placei TaxID=6290 RepID=A0A3P7UI90_HAEPC|nr:unnamed protein product [Haemonchus placei]